MHLSFLGPASCFFGFSLPPPAPQPPGRWWHLLDHRHCFPFGKPSLTFRDLKSPMAVTSLFIDVAGDIPFHTIFHFIPETSNLSTLYFCLCFQRFINFIFFSSCLIKFHYCFVIFIAISLNDRDTFLDWTACYL